MSLDKNSPPLKTATDPEAKQSVGLDPLKHVDAANRVKQPRGTDILVKRGESPRGPKIKTHS